ncbi:hypothetical protein K443DRAFT_116822 [Laccaria amethystina LaAM-08-1]|uniref:Uncharacterized protein n=1 Tax=Laccaria amethystina LaAM-08-1 TaxID=1095629 RepID=A0A0C9X137_9AGAR|nr:hypothetical protein K443DRAFT_116822 [Laccaria amethystina LaAM-08-1]
MQSKHSPLNEINFTQHSINFQTFREEMALGSWIKSPLYPCLDKVTQIIEKRMTVISFPLK